MQPRNIGAALLVKTLLFDSVTYVRFYFWNCLFECFVHFSWLSLLSVKMIVVKFVWQECCDHTLFMIFALVVRPCNVHTVHLCFAGLGGWEGVLVAVKKTILVQWGFS